MTPALDKLLAPVKGHDPAGADLAYDPQRHFIEQAFDAPVSIDASGIASDDADTDWRAVVAAIVEQSERTKDVWLAVYLVRAGARLGLLPTVAAGAQMLAGLVEDFWSTVHPKIEDYGFEARKGACDTLTQFREFLGPFGRIVLVDHPRLGRFTIDDLVRYRRNGDAEDDYGLYRAALDEEPPERLGEASAAIVAIRDGLLRTDAALMLHAGTGVGTNFRSIYETFDAIQGAMASMLSDRAIANGEVVAQVDGPMQDERPLAKSAPTTIESREDVIRTLDILTRWYARNEPASPVPLLLERAKTWVASDFLTILQDIAPSAIDDARRVLTAKSAA